VSISRAAFLLVIFTVPLSGYSVLTHEAIIDTAWDTSLKALLKKRFPDVTPEQLKEAHAYAYGGAIIQDMGYYPFGSKTFSDLVHYVRSGDFVIALIHESQDVNEYAFALGALAHYSSDNEGHPIATNRIVPLLYPKLKTKFGSVVTYEDDPVAHIKVEFGFDVVQVAQGAYAPQAYHDYIGFQVSKPVLERAFADTYSVPLKDFFLSLDLALGTYRRTVSGLIPEMTKSAWAAKKDEIVKAHPGITERKFRYNLRRASFEKEWGRQYEKPGLGARFLAFLFRLIPKIGPFKALAFHPLTPQTEGMFMESFNRSLARYQTLIGEESAGNLTLADNNFDTGKLSVAGEYHLADQAYGKLLEKLADVKGDVSPELRTNILSFYRDPNAVPAGKARQEWDRLQTPSPQPTRPATI
jgi:Zinc dependent phospholipase C